MREWLTRSPSFEEVAGEVRDSRKRQGRVAIVIPVYRRLDMLREHLGKLNEQTFRDFDLIIVYGKEDEFLDVPAIHIREKNDTGCAAAYYMGQRKALDEGYEIIILADDDAHPVSKDLVERLVSAVRGRAEVAYPKVAYPPCVSADHGRIIHHYGCVRADVFRKSGLTYVPFTVGGEDIELQERFSWKGHAMMDIESLAEHPKRPPLQIEEGSKLHHYQRGHLLSHLVRGRYYAAWRFIIFNTMMGIGFLLLGKKLGLRFISAMWSGSGMTFFREKPGKVSPPEPSEGVGSGYMELGLGSKIPVPYDYLSKDRSIGRRIGWFLTYARNLPKFFNRKMLLIDRNRITPDMPVMLVARKTCLRYKGTDYVISDDSSLPVIALRSAIFAWMVPLVMLWALILLCRGWVLRKMKRIRTDGYGVRF